MTDNIEKEIFQYFKDFTMIPESIYEENLRLIAKFNDIVGAIVECGVWRGGMIAGIAKMQADKNREYYLFDSFEGLPKAEKIDGTGANEWQRDTKSDKYYDNCKADQAYAEQAMKLSGAINYSVIKGW